MTFVGLPSALSMIVLSRQSLAANAVDDDRKTAGETFDPRFIAVNGTLNLLRALFIVQNLNPAPDQYLFRGCRPLTSFGLRNLRIRGCG